MLVYIEIHVNGEKLHRWSPDDFEMEMPPPRDHRFETIARHKEKFVAHFLDQFQLRMQAMLHCIQTFDLYVIFDSKVNRIEIFPHEMREFEKEITNGQQTRTQEEGTQQLEGTGTQSE